jgi:hypothetical protein
LFLEEEWDINVHRATVGRLLQKKRVTRKQGELIGPRSQCLRTECQAKIQDVTTEHLIFCDESIFKAQSAWRCMGYGPIGEACRWSEDMRRDNTYSILPAYIVDGYLPCIDIKQGFFNGEDRGESYNDRHVRIHVEFTQISYPLSPMHRSKVVSSLCLHILEC